MALVALKTFCTLTVVACFIGVLHGLHVPADQKTKDNAEAHVSSFQTPPNGTMEHNKRFLSLLLPVFSEILVDVGLMSGGLSGAGTAVGGLLGAGVLSRLDGLLGKGVVGHATVPKIETVGQVVGSIALNIDNIVRLPTLPIDHATDHGSSGNHGTGNQVTNTPPIVLDGSHTLTEAEIRTLTPSQVLTLMVPGRTPNQNCVGLKDDFMDGGVHLGVCKSSCSSEEEATWSLGCVNQQCCVKDITNGVFCMGVPIGLSQYPIFPGSCRLSCNATTEVETTFDKGCKKWQSCCIDRQFIFSL